jgi:hypothetical protein
MDLHLEHDRKLQISQERTESGIQNLHEWEGDSGSTTDE